MYHYCGRGYTEAAVAKETVVRVCVCVCVCPSLSVDVSFWWNGSVIVIIKWMLISLPSCSVPLPLTDDKYSAAMCFWITQVYFCTSTETCSHSDSLRIDKFATGHSVRQFGVYWQWPVITTPVWQINGTCLISLVYNIIIILKIYVIDNIAQIQKLSAEQNMYSKCNKICYIHYP